MVLQPIAPRAGAEVTSPSTAATPSSPASMPSNPGPTIIGVALAIALAVGVLAWRQGRVARWHAVALGGLVGFALGFGLPGVGDKLAWYPAHFTRTLGIGVLAALVGAGIGNMLSTGGGAGTTPPSNSDRRRSHAVTGAGLGFVVGFALVWQGCGRGPITSIDSSAAAVCSLGGAVVAILGALLGAIFGAPKSNG
jgi:hypothetical protein